MLVRRVPLPQAASEQEPAEPAEDAAPVESDIAPPDLEPAIDPEPAAQTSAPEVKIPFARVSYSSACDQQCPCLRSHSQASRMPC
eukprot:scaffold399559_cov33-Prasinocladus_malaysianus.AAC.2